MGEEFLGRKEALALLEMAGWDEPALLAEGDEAHKLAHAGAFVDSSAGGGRKLLHQPVEDFIPLVLVDGWAAADRVLPGGMAKAVEGLGGAVGGKALFHLLFDLDVESEGQDFNVWQGLG